MELSERIRKIAGRQSQPATADVYNEWADEVAQLEVELAECRQANAEVASLNGDLQIEDQRLRELAQAVIDADKDMGNHIVALRDALKEGE